MLKFEKSRNIFMEFRLSRYLYIGAFLKKLFDKVQKTNFFIKKVPLRTWLSKKSISAY